MADETTPPMAENAGEPTPETAEFRTLKVRTRALLGQLREVLGEEPSEAGIARLIVLAKRTLDAEALAEAGDAQLRPLRAFIARAFTLPPDEDPVAGAVRILSEYRQAGPPETVKPPTLEDAAELLLTVLQPNHQDAIRDVAGENRWPKWVIFAGAVARAADNMELHAGEFDPEWLNQPGAVKPAVRIVACEAADCGLVIPAPRRGQRFCCSAHGSDKAWHSEGCAAASSKGLGTGKPLEVENAELRQALVTANRAPTAGAGGWGHDTEEL